MKLKLMSEMTSSSSSSSSSPRDDSRAGRKSKNASPIIKSCLRCDKGKRCCDRELPVCGRCAKNGKQCVYRHNLSEEEQERIKSAGQQRRREIARQKSEAAVVSVNEMMKLEMMMDELFLGVCVENFNRNMGVLFSFGDELLDLKSLHATPARSVRTDTIMAMVFRGMGWVAQEKLFLERANANVLRLTGASSDTSSAYTMLGISSMGGDLQHSKKYLLLSAQTQDANFRFDLSESLSYYLLACMRGSLDPKLLEIINQFTSVFFKRIQLRARHVRAALEARLSLDEIARYGSWDYADNAGGYACEEKMSVGLAKALLTEMQEKENIIQSLLYEVSLTAPEVSRITLERKRVKMAATRCALNYYLGEVKAARVCGYETLKLFASVGSVLWFFASAEDLVHVVDVSIGIQDKALFDQGMTILRRMSPFYPIAEKLVFALANSPDLFGGDSALKIESLDVAMDEALSSGDLGQWIETV